MIILPPHLVHHSDGIGIAGRGRVCEARYWSDAAVCYSGEFCNCGALIGAVTLTGPTMTFSDGTSAGDLMENDECVWRVAPPIALAAADDDDADGARGDGGGLRAITLLLTRVSIKHSGAFVEVAASPLWLLSPRSLPAVCGCPPCAALPPFLSCPLNLALWRQAYALCLRLASMN